MVIQKRKSIVDAAGLNCNGFHSDSTACGYQFNVGYDVVRVHNQHLIAAIALTYDVDLALLEGTSRTGGRLRQVAISE